MISEGQKLINLLKFVLYKEVKFGDDPQDVITLVVVTAISKAV